MVEKVRKKNLQKARDQKYEVLSKEAF